MSKGKYKLFESNKNYLSFAIDDLQLEIAAYIPHLICEECGQLRMEGTICDCWKRRPLTTTPYDYIYMLGLDCLSCTYQEDVYCECYRVREKTKCKQCLKSLSYKDFINKKHFCSWKCLTLSMSHTFYYT